MNQQSVNQLEDLTPTPSMNLLDEPIPEISVPILKPLKPILNSIAPSVKNLTNKVSVSVNKNINEFKDWILSYVPEPIKKTVNQQVESLKKQVNQFFKKLDKFVPKEQETALAGYLKTYRIDGQTGYDPKTFTSNIKPKEVDLINRQNKPLKVKLILTCKFIRENPANGQIDENSGYFNSNVLTITESTDIFQSILTEINKLLEMVEKFQNQGSGWQFDQVEYFDINIDPFQPLSGSSYITLPTKLASKTAIINVKNEKDHECFKRA